MIRHLLYQADIATIFNNFFSSIGDSIQSDVPTQYISRPTASFLFSPVTHYIIDKIITSLKNKSGNTDTYPVKVLKYLSSLISPILSGIVNKALPCGRFPNCLKISRVIPFHKGGDTRDVSNYRPISLRPFLVKCWRKLCPTIYPTILKI